MAQLQLKAFDDTLWTQQDSDNGIIPSDEEVGDVAVRRIKNN